MKRLFLVLLLTGLISIPGISQERDYGASVSDFEVDLGWEYPPADTEFEYPEPEFNVPLGGDEEAVYDGSVDDGSDE